MNKRFNPYKMFNGSFIPETISQIPIKELSFGAKVTYGRLLRYSGKDGICKPKRATLAREIGSSVSNVDKLIKELCSFGLIEKEQRGLQKSNEYHFLFHTVLGDTELSEPTTPKLSDVTTPIVRESVEESNIYKYIHTLPDSMGKTYQTRIFHFYSLAWKEKYGFNPRENYARFGKAIKSLHENYSEYQVAMLILTHFDWKGASGEDEFTHKRLSDAGFPIDWIPRSSDVYKAFIINSRGIQFDSEDVCKEIIDKYLKI